MTRSAAPPPTDHNPLGLIGLGLLGTALAERLLASGYEVRGFDRDSRRCDALGALGGRPAQDSSEVVRACPVTILCLPDSDVVAAVVEEIGPALVRRKRLIDTTTGDPRATAELGARLDRSGIDYLDATVGGSSDQARRGEILLMVGGRAEIVADCRPVLQALTSRIFHLGPWGSGARMKLVLNLVIGLHRAVLAEALTLAESSELDLPRVLEVLRAGPGHSAVMDLKGEKMVSEDFRPQARLAQHLKDVRLIQRLAERTGLTLPLSSVHEQLLERAVALGFGEADNSAVIKAVSSFRRE